MGELSPWHLLILAAVFVLLFGAKKLPDAARSDPVTTAGQQTPAAGERADTR